jgi:hypothetical protein
MGTAATATTEYLIAGETTVNVLDFQDVADLLGWDSYGDAAQEKYEGRGNPQWSPEWLSFGDASWSAPGLAEWRIGGDQDDLALGMGGHQANVGTLIRAAGAVGLWQNNQRIDRYNADHGVDYTQMFRNSYGYGDDVARRTVRRITKGVDLLHVGLEEGAVARTTRRSGSLGRDIHIGALGAGVEGQLRASVVLQHEAHRDGVISDSLSQDLETKRAVEAHTEMALALIPDYGRGFLDSQLVEDISAYDSGAAAFRSYVGDTYDSSADYWKLIRHADGTFTMEDDGRDDVTIVDESNGEVVEEHRYEGGSRTAFIAEKLGLSREAVNQAMADAGWSWSKVGGWGNERTATEVVFAATEADVIEQHIGMLFEPAPRQGLVGWAEEQVAFGVERLGDAWSWAQRQVRPEYYRDGSLELEDFGALSSGQPSHEEDTAFPRLSWYTHGHPAIDTSGEGAYRFAEDLYLVATGRNDDRVLYQIRGTEDYLYVSHVPEEEVRSLEDMLEASRRDKVLFRADEDLFRYPTEADIKPGDIATGPHIHTELARQRADGSYWFADPSTGDFLPDFDYQWSIDNNWFEDWFPKTLGWEGWR